MLLIDQGSEEDVLIPEPQKRPAKAPRGRPLSESAQKVQQLVENCFANSTYVDTVDFRESRYVIFCGKFSRIRIFHVLELKFDVQYVALSLTRKTEIQ